MDKLVGNQYSYDQAVDEADKMRKKIGGSTASAYEYGEAEKEIETEQKFVVPAPISEQREEKINEALQKRNEVDEEIERRLREIRIQLKEQLGKEADENYSKVSRELGGEAREELIEWLQKAYQGEFGRGELVVVNNSDRDSSPQLVRVVLIEGPQDQNNRAHKKNIGRLSNAQKLECYELCRPNKPDVLEEIKKLTTYSDVEQFLTHHKFIEVDFAGTTEEELDVFASRLKKNGCPISSILEIFPKDYQPKVKEGEVLEFRGSGHHSGDIDGKQIVLPTGRLAVVSKYEGENEEVFGTYHFWGIVTDPHIKPSWSAKFGGWEGPELDSPTQEEIDFLKGKQVSFSDQDMLEEDKKMLGI